MIEADQGPDPDPTGGPGQGLNDDDAMRRRYIGGDIIDVCVLKISEEYFAIEKSSIVGLYKMVLVGKKV